jgi:hypothetical protein
MTHRPRMDLELPPAGVTDEAAIAAVDHIGA